MLDKRNEHDRCVSLFTIVVNLMTVKYNISSTYFKNISLLDPSFKHVLNSETGKVIVGSDLDDKWTVSRSLLKNTISDSRPCCCCRQT
jgi:hypothetical protein